MATFLQGIAKTWRSFDGNVVSSSLYRTELIPSSSSSSFVRICKNFGKFASIHPNLNSPSKKLINYRAFSSSTSSEKSPKNGASDGSHESEGSPLQNGGFADEKAGKSAEKMSIWRWGFTSSSSMLSKEKQKVASVPQKIEGFENCKITSVSAGRIHSAFVVDGKLFTFGGNSEFQLGRPVPENISAEDACLSNPEEVKIEGDPYITSVSCGAFHTAAVSADGTLYTWGWGGSFFSGAGALGNGSKQLCKEPTPVKVGSGDEAVVQVAAGQQHSIILTDAGKLYSCGKGDFGRLGRGKNGDQTRFQEIEFFSMLNPETRISSISCGASHSAALGEKGDVWVWGRNDFGQLGVEESLGDVYSSEIYPRNLEFFSSANFKVRSLASADRHMLALTETGAVFFWGGRAWLSPKNVRFKLPTPDEGNPKKLKKVVGGSGRGSCFFSMAITEDGDLYSWGKDASQCLSRDTHKNANEPGIVDRALFEGQDVVDLAGGYYRVLAVTAASKD